MELQANSAATAPSGCGHGAVAAACELSRSLPLAAAQYPCGCTRGGLAAATRYCGATKQRACHARRYWRMPTRLRLEAVCADIV